MSKTHGLCYDKLYSVHTNMKRRILEESNKRYENYGGRGIKICDEWVGKDGFINFYKWAMENGYQEALSLEREDVDGNYEPSNCTWITMDAQARNKSNTVWLTINGDTKTLQEWAEISGVESGTIWFRYKNGYKEYDLIKSSDSKSNEKYIYWEERKQRWRVRIRLYSGVKSFGTYPTIKEAVEKRNSILKENNMII